MRSEDRHTYARTGECARHAHICGFLCTVPLAQGWVMILPAAHGKQACRRLGGCAGGRGGWRRGRGSGAEALVDGVDVAGGVVVAGGVDMAWGELPAGWTHSPRARSSVALGTFLSCKQMLEIWAFGGRWVGVMPRGRLGGVGASGDFRGSECREMRFFPS